MVAGCIGYMEAGEYFLNNFMWSQVKNHVRDYAIRKQQETVLKFQVASQQHRLANQDSADLLDDDEPAAQSKEGSSSKQNN